MPAPKAGAATPQARWMPLVSVRRRGRRRRRGPEGRRPGAGRPGQPGPRGTVRRGRRPSRRAVRARHRVGRRPRRRRRAASGWIWAELWTDDLKGSATFYKTVVGYETWQVGSGKAATWIYASGGRPRARAARMPFEKVPAQWLPYVVVKDLQIALARVTEFGGHVLRRPGAKGPQFAVVSDPGGATFILEQRPEQPVDEVAQAPAAGREARPAEASAPPPPPPDVPADPFGLDAAQQKSPSRRPRHRPSAGTARAGRSPCQAANFGADVMVVVAPAPYANVWIAPPGLGTVLGGRGLGLARQAGSGRAWWGYAADLGARSTAPPYYPGGGGYYPGYRPPPAPGRWPRSATAGSRIPPTGSRPPRHRRPGRAPGARALVAPRGGPPLPCRARRSAPRRRRALKTIVVKIGGEVAGTPEMDAIARDVRALVEDGHRVSMVHGGGPQATALQERLGIETRIVAGKRFTDAGDARGDEVRGGREGERRRLRPAARERRARASGSTARAATSWRRAAGRPG